MPVNQFMGAQNSIFQILLSKYACMWLAARSSALKGRTKFLDFAAKIVTFSLGEKFGNKAEKREGEGDLSGKL